MGTDGQRTLIGLLRGINVGGKRPLRMDELRRIVGSLGGADVRTYIQSGNVVFRWHGGPDDVRNRLELALADVTGFDIPVAIRTREQLASALSSNPYSSASDAAAAVHIGFLREAPSADAIATLDPDRSPTDQFAIRGMEIFLHCPNGLARTSLTAQYFDSHLGTTVTFRNLRTAGKLLDMCQA